MRLSRLVHVLLAICIGVILTLVQLSSCVPEEGSFLDDYYASTFLSVAGQWDGDNLRSNPEVVVVIDGPEKTDWQLSVVLEGGVTYKANGLTGERLVCVLDGAGLGPDRRVTSASVSVFHPETDEILFIRKDVVISLEGDFDGGSDEPGPVTPEDEPRVVAKSLSFTGDGVDMVLPLDGATPRFELQESGSGVLTLGFSLYGREVGPVQLEADVTVGSEHLRIDSVERLDGPMFRIAVFALSEGSGRLELVLRGCYSSYVQFVDFRALPDGRIIEFIPNVFCFSDQNDARGVVVPMGFREGETCDIVVNYKERDTGAVGRTVYSSVSGREPLTVTLWSAGAAKDWREVSFWVELFVPGKDKAVYVTPTVSVFPFRPSFTWWEENGAKYVKESEPVRTRTAYSGYQLGVLTDYRYPSHLHSVIVSDLSGTGRVWTSYKPEPDTDGLYMFSIGRLPRGNRTFRVTFNTDEGEYDYMFSRSFCDVWTVMPYIGNHSGLRSLFAYVTGPETYLQASCVLDIYIDIYGVFEYTTAVIEDNVKVNRLDHWWHYVTTRGFDHTLDYGTGHVDLLIQSGWVNTAIKYLFESAGGLPWSLVGQKATFWGPGGVIQVYQPGSSRPGVILTAKADDAFYKSGYDIEVDISRLVPVLEENGIIY